MNRFTASQIAEAMQVTSRTIRARASKECWPCDLVPGRGGQIPHYFLADLPSDVARALSETFPESVLTDSNDIKGTAAGKKYAAGVSITNEIRQEKRQDALKAIAGLNSKQKQRAEVAFQILKAAETFHKESGGPKVAAWNRFVSAYNSRQLNYLPESLYLDRPQIGFSTLTRWEANYAKEGIAGLICKYRSTKGNSLIDTTPELKSFCLAMLFEYPHVKASSMLEALESQFAGEFHLPTISTCSRWLKSWKEENQSVFMSLVNPSGWQNSRMVAFGNKSAEISRINQLWEFDSTPADVMLIDGRFSIVGLIDVATRRPMVVLKPTSNSEAIALLIRKAIIEWGLPEQVRTDNGSDYTSVHISTVWDALGIEHRSTNPYSGWEKPFIERFFRTFSHGIAELCEGYIGHSVEERQRINARLTFAQRLLEKRKKGEAKIAINVNLSAAQFESFINDWIEHLYNHKTHSALGCSPFEKYTSMRQQIRKLADPHVLDVLLAPVPGNKGYRTITKGEGIKVEGGQFISPELGAFVGDRVFCRWNPKDVGRIFVFHGLTGQFICEAQDPEVAGQNIDLRAIADEAKRIQRAQLAKQRQEIKASTKRYNVRGIAHQIISHKATLNGSVAAFPKQVTEATSTAIESTSEALKQSQSQHSYTAAQLSEFEQKRKSLEVLETYTKPIFETDAHKARYLTELSIKTELPATEKAWLHQYRRNNRAAAALLDDILESAKTIKGESL